MQPTHGVLAIQSQLLRDATARSTATATPASAGGDRSNRGGLATTPSSPLSPPPPSSANRIARTLLHYVWPVGEPALRGRVALAMALLIGGKLVNIQVPFIFKHIADALTPVNDAVAAAVAAASADGAAAVAALGDPHTVAVVGVAALVVPSTLLLGYGLARATASGMTELRNAVFASVAQRAIRLVSRDVFRHLHDLDLKFHLDRSTGALARTVERGARSINFVLTSLVFNVVPTLLEIGLVAGILAVNCGWEYAGECVPHF